MEKIKKGDTIEYIPKEGRYAGKKLVCTITDIMELYKPGTFEPVKKILVETIVNGHKECFALPDDAYDNISK